MTYASQDIAAALRRQDTDRYLSVLYAPENKRPALFALYAFNVEIASVRDRIREALPGEIRLQWWRDVLAAGTVEAGQGHPLATALVEAILAHRLPVSAFDNMLEARIFDLYNDPMPSRTDLEGYCGETASALIQLAALVLDPTAAPNSAEQAGHAGCAQAIAGILRLLPLHRARGQCYIPADMLAAVGTTPEAFVAGRDEAAAGRAIEAMVALGREHWRAFERGAPISSDVWPAFQPASLTPMYLDAAARAGLGTLTEPVRVAEWRLHWRYFRDRVLPSKAGRRRG